MQSETNKTKTWIDGSDNSPFNKLRQTIRLKRERTFKSLFNRNLPKCLVYRSSEPKIRGLKMKLHWPGLEKMKIVI